ncbi:hypothetical protein BUE80_DR012990 [Diplocarpon rosae]|nr:hypothetical protein BUE80_DR012990 [Diplocarpon rosae]
MEKSVPSSHSCDNLHDKPKTPSRKKSSTIPNTPHNGALPSLRKPSAPTPNSPCNNVHPSSRKLSASASTPTLKGLAPKPPASAPVRPRKPVEPTLLGDFLLGRPSPSRQRRRRSLDAVKREMRTEVRAPGKVNARVKEWQRASKGAGAGEEPEEIVWQRASKGAGAGEEPEEIVVTYETDSDVAPVLVVQKKPRKRNSKPVREREKEGQREASEKSKSAAPKKRVISDDHWMKKKKKSPKAKGTPLPKNFLQTTAVNPPVEKKIEDWVARTQAEPEPVLEKARSRSRKVLERELDGGPKKRADSEAKRPVGRLELGNGGIRVTGSKLSANDDGIRVTAARATSNDDGIRIRPLRECSPHAELRIKPVRKDGSKRRPKEEAASPTPTPRKKSAQHLVPPEVERKSRVTSHVTSHRDAEDNCAHTSPSPREGVRRQSRKSGTPTGSLDEIPFGNSAFSVLELPIGAEANTLRRPEPRRNASFSAVPKALKRVYTEGKKMMQDSPEPARGGINQPPSIDSWLNGTVDPFVEGSPPPAAGADSGAPASPISSPKGDDRIEKRSPEEAREHGEPPRRKGRRRQSLEREEEEAQQASSSPVQLKHRDTLPSMESSAPASPPGLRRSPATRNASSPRFPRKISLKDAVLDAFKGESSVGKAATSPFDFIGLKERDTNRAEDYRSGRELEAVAEDPPPQRSPRTPEQPVLGDPKSSRALPAFPRRLAPTTGAHRLSTIASVETFSTASGSSLTETSAPSELTQTTLTQESVLSATTASTVSRTTVSSLSRHSKASTSNRSRQSSNGGLKRRLTKHSDLVSMLSLPDADVPGRGQSIRSARSLRTTKTPLETATVEDIMQELAEDERKYMRELNTLVDGVIPVLLTCVLSKSDSAIAAGLFDPDASAAGSLLTKPIVDMGVALERLKSLHRRIPLTEAHEFLRWAPSAVKTYEDYLRAWRSGFEDVVVNLAPASRTSLLAENSDPDKMKSDKHGDLLRESGERADVSYLLKRPLARIKGLAKATKGLAKLLDTKQAETIRDSFEKLESFRRQRMREEVARQEDQRANNTDTSRARDTRTMAHVIGVTIDRARKVYMKDVFSFEMIHSNGQHLECEVELTYRYDDSNQLDRGDVLICQTDGTNFFLLFPPVAFDNLSARRGETDTQLVLMVRGRDAGGREWRESFMLDAKEEEVATEWLRKLSTTPVPPPIIHYKPKLDPELETVLSEAGGDTKSIVGALKSRAPDDIPLGERPRREAEERAAGGKPGLMYAVYQTLSEERISELGEFSVLDVKDLNEAMNKAGKKPLVLPSPRPTTPRMQRASRYHGARVSELPCAMAGGLDPYPGDEDLEHLESSGRYSSEDNDRTPTKHEPITTSKRPEPSSRTACRPENMSPPVKAASRQEPAVVERYHPRPPSRAEEDTPPPPPAHRTPSTPPLKLTPILESPTPRAKNRRTSSPLKHEYQPSDISDATTDASDNLPASELSETEAASDSYLDLSDDSLDELDEFDDDQTRPTTAATAATVPTDPTPTISRPASIYSHPNVSLAPPHAASQVPPFIRPAAPRPSTATRTITAMVSCWSNQKGKWEDVHDEPCAVVVGPGRVECFDLSCVPTSPVRDDEADSDARPSRASDPLVGQDITPHVNLRQSTRIDLEITAPPSASSQMKGVALTLRYRTLNQQDSEALYKALHSARLENLKYIMMEQQRFLASFGQNPADEQATAGSHRGPLLRKQSFRRTEDSAPPQSTVASEQSSPNSSLKAVKRFGIGGIFNLSRSSVQAGPGGGMSISSSDYSIATPPHTSNPSLSSMLTTGVAVRDLGWKDLPIKLYVASADNRWAERGAAYLTVSTPPPGMRQASSLENGPQKRITVTQQTRRHGLIYRLDCVLGAECFSKLGQRGVIANVWQDIRDDRGVEGFIGARGGVSGRLRKWCFQALRAGDCEWIYSLCRSGT